MKTIIKFPRNPTEISLFHIKNAERREDKVPFNISVMIRFPEITAGKDKFTLSLSFTNLESGDTEIKEIDIEVPSSWVIMYIHAFLFDYKAEYEIIPPIPR